MPLAGVQIVPPLVVPMVRSALQAQGLDPNLVESSGQISASALFAMAFNRIEVRTTMGPAVVIDMDEPTSPEMEALLRRVKPMITLTGRGGKVVISPYGVPSAIDSVFESGGSYLGLGVGAALLGVALLGGALLRR